MYNNNNVVDNLLKSGDFQNDRHRVRFHSVLNFENRFQSTTLDWDI